MGCTSSKYTARDDGVALLSQRNSFLGTPRGSGATPNLYRKTATPRQKKRIAVARARLSNLPESAITGTAVPHHQATLLGGEGVAIKHDLGDVNEDVPLLLANCHRTIWEGFSELNDMVIIEETVFSVGPGQANSTSMPGGSGNRGNISLLGSTNHSLETFGSLTLTSVDTETFERQSDEIRSKASCSGGIRGGIGGVQKRGQAEEKDYAETEFRAKNIGDNGVSTQGGLSPLQSQGSHSVLSTEGQLAQTVPPSNPMPSVQSQNNGYVPSKSPGNLSALNSPMPEETPSTPTAQSSTQAPAIALATISSPPLSKVDYEDEEELQTPPGDGPWLFQDIINAKFKRLCSKLRRKLNKDPWDEFKGFDDEEITDFVQAYPMTCRVRYEFDSFTGQLLPLSLICTMDASVATVKATYEAYHEAVLEHDVWIGTPLHYACSYQAKKAVVRFLIQQESSMLGKINHFGRTPLHMACLFKASLPTISPLIFVYPQAVEIHDKDGYTPIHLSCENGTTVEVMEALMESNPKSSGMARTNNKDSTPLHLACSNLASKSILKVLLEQCPSAAECLDVDGQLPLHIAVQSMLTTKKSIEMLVRAFPGSLGIRNERQETPFLIAKRNNLAPKILELLAKSSHAAAV